MAPAHERVGHRRLALSLLCRSFHTPALLANASNAIGLMQNPSVELDVNNNLRREKVHMKLKKIVSAVALMVVPFFGSICQAQVAINGAQEVQFGTSLTLPPGNQLYIYGM